MTKNPWDVPPIPKKGDETEDAVYVAVGRALSQWETFERQLLRLFSWSIGGNVIADMASQRAYGSVLTFRGRADMLRAVLDTKFHYEKDKLGHEDAKRLISIGERFSPRRNEIAHGIVRQFRVIETGPLLGYCLFPNEISTSKNALVERIGYDHPRPAPRYTYSSDQIRAFGNEFFWLGTSAQELLLNLIGSALFHPQYRKRSIERGLRCR